MWHILNLYSHSIFLWLKLGLNCSGKIPHLATTFIIARSRIALVCLFIFTTLNFIAQENSPDDYNLETEKIDAETAPIDKHTPKMVNCDAFPDSVAGEKLVAVTKQAYRKLTKYTLKTNRAGTRMDIKSVDLYLYKDTLIKAVVFYSESKSDFWEKIYYKDNFWFSTLGHPGDMRISLEEDYMEYFKIAGKLKQACK
jgi:hypothetical protein